MCTVPPDKTGNLETLARSRFGDLTEAEVKLLRAAPKGEIAWCGPTQDNDDPANDPSKADDWGPEREVRANIIRWLCVDQQATERVDPRGIRIYAAKIVTNLDLSFATLEVPLDLYRCRLIEEAFLGHAHIPTLNLAGSWTRSLAADGIHVTGDFLLRRGFTTEGEVRFLGAEIGGNLDCSGATFRNPGDDALSADGARVKGDVFLGQGLTASGKVRLLGAQIDGDLDLAGGTLMNPSGTALGADRAHVGGTVFLCSFPDEGEVKHFAAEGEVRLLGAQIGGNLDCEDGKFKNSANKERPESGVALQADRVKVGGSVYLRQGFTAEGEVRLVGAQIGSNLGCDGGTFKNPSRRALTADLARLAGSVFLRGGFTSEGEVRFSGAQIGGDLSCVGGAFGKVNAEKATIKGSLWWRGVQQAGKAELDFINASAGAIVDNKSSWPNKGNLFLDGFTYTRISGGPRDAKTRLGWLSRQRKFTPQPYRQLANVLRDTGDERGAHEVLYEMERLRRKNEDHRWHEHVSSWLLRWTIGYGHKMRRVTLWLLGLTLIGFALSGLGYLGGAMVPSQREAFATFNKTGATPAYYPHFNAAIFSIEHSFPFVDLGERDHWAPAPGGSGRTPVFARWVFQWMRDYNIRGFHPFRLNAPGFLRFWLWAQIAAGWVLATLFVAGLTGIVKSR